MPQSLPPIIWIALVLQYFCGHYTTFFKSTIWNILSRILCVTIIPIVACSTVDSNLSGVDGNYYIHAVIFQLVNFLIGVVVSFIDGSYFFRFHTSLLSIMSPYSLKTGRRSLLYISIYFGILFILKSYSFWDFLTGVVDMSFYNAFGFFEITYGNIFSASIRCIIFEWNWFAVKTLRKALRKMAFKSKNTVADIQVKDIVQVVTTYDELLRNFMSLGFTLKILVRSYQILIIFRIRLCGILNVLEASYICD